MEQENSNKPNRGGRPLKPIKRDKLLAVKCTGSEKGAIEQKAKALQITVSEYLREISLTGKIKAKNKALPKEILALTGTLNHVAANLNQIAKRLNMAGDFDPAERSKLKLQVQELKALTTLIKDSFR
ncbi:plasmid mobilization protein [Deminuibacter soli]|uniref:Plasmid mobilization relaxosome protein MobC n=1 Tax=Deminuibacter soli TaxID=2291815 RepID=A0A3E1NH41_9BACT|nr:plasmid mobilization relaxosome protein MobC [Deminuibacter soli]RFM27207.1 plasmid mobilization relaxosome protein MobC [Deminuibacter soli]